MENPIDYLGQQRSSCFLRHGEKSIQEFLLRNFQNPYYQGL